VITIGFTGFDGGRLGALVDVNLHVASDSIEQVEDIHLILEHLITKVLREDVQRVTSAGELEVLFPQAMHNLMEFEENPVPNRPPAAEINPLRSKSSLELFTAISRELAVELNLRDLLRRILRLTLENLEATSGSVVVLNEIGEVIEGAMVYNGKLQNHSPQQFAEVIDRGLAGWVVENRQSALIANTREDPRWLRRSWDQEREEARSAISVPLITNERVVGVLTLVNSQAGKFTDEDLSLLTAIAVFASLVNYAV
jgi:transcriptional regulator with GAF, ATPase, and Fis domain